MCCDSSYNLLNDLQSIVYVFVYLRSLPAKLTLLCQRSNYLGLVKYIVPTCSHPFISIGNMAICPPSLDCRTFSIYTGLKVLSCEWHRLLYPRTWPIRISLLVNRICKLFTYVDYTVIERDRNTMLPSLTFLKTFLPTIDFSHAWHDKIRISSYNFTFPSSSGNCLLLEVLEIHCKVIKHRRATSWRVVPVTYTTARATNGSSIC